MSKLCNIGSLNLDKVYSLPHIVREGETLQASHLEFHPGGKGLNQSIALARAGFPVYHAGCIGTDGQILEILLKSEGCNTQYLKQIQGETGHAIIQRDSSGQNSIFVYPGANASYTKTDIDALLCQFQAGDTLLVQNEMPHTAYIIEKAHAYGLQVILNPSPLNEEIRKINPALCTLILLNELECQEWCGKSHPSEALEFFRKQYPQLKIVLTLGAQGAIYQDSEQKIYQDAFSVPVVDTTGAGDTFTGFFLAHWLKGDPIPHCLLRASIAAALCVTQKGASSSIPNAASVQGFLEEGRGKR